MTNLARSISVIVPVYNEAMNLPLLFERLTRVLETLSYDWEIIFINDGSRDRSARILDEFAKKNTRVRVIEFTRNFGKEIATTAGIHASRGAAAIMIDADLQHPIERIPEFVRAWEQGAQVVIGVREKNIGEGMTKRVGSALFYCIMGLISDTRIEPRATDFRLLDRQVVTVFCQLTEKNRMTRGLIDWLGFEHTFVPFQAPARADGKAKYGTLQLIHLAMSAFVNHSLFPLKVAGYLGILIMFFSAPLGVFILIEQYLLRDPWNLHFSGTAMLAVMNLFLIGIVLACLGLITLYIAHIHSEVMNRPMYVVRRRVNFTSSE